MGTLARIQVSLHRDGSIPEDVSTNTMHFEGDEDEPAFTYREKWDNDIVGLVDRVVLFYQTIQGQLSSTLAGTGTVKAYDMTDPEERLPRVVEDFNFTPGDSALPAECAAVVSFKAEPLSGVVQSRRRGRIFVGPLSTGVVLASGADARYNNTNALNLLTAFETMAVGGAGAFRLAIYSRASDPSGLGVEDAAWNDATEAWVDNAFDTQRRRGARATVRQTTTLS